MDPSKVDVNVHPAKLEVRFQEENKIFQSIYHAIKDVLLKSELVADTEKTLDTNEVQKEESKGLFDFRKNETEKIEKYNEEESKIKTNVGFGGPINTADVLEQLRTKKTEMEPTDPNTPVVDMDYELMAYSNIKIDYDKRCHFQNQQNIFHNHAQKLSNLFLHFGESQNHAGNIQSTGKECFNSDNDIIGIKNQNIKYQNDNRNSQSKDTIDNRSAHS